MKQTAAGAQGFPAAQLPATFTHLALSPATELMGLQGQRAGSRASSGDQPPLHLQGSCPQLAQNPPAYKQRMNKGFLPFQRPPHRLHSAGTTNQRSPRNPSTPLSRKTEGDPTRRGTELKCVPSNNTQHRWNECVAQETQRGHRQRTQGGREDAEGTCHKMGCSNVGADGVSLEAQVGDPTMRITKEGTETSQEGVELRKSCRGTLQNTESLYRTVHQLQAFLESQRSVTQPASPWG